MNLKDFIKKDKMNIYNKTIYIIEFILSFVLAICIYKILYKYEDYQIVSKIDLVIAIIAGLFIIGITVLNIKLYKNYIEKLFLSFIIPIGMLFVVLLPPYNTPDEDGHIYRAYDVSVGNFITPFGEKNEGDIYVPKVVLELARTELTYSTIHNKLQEKTDYNDIIPVQTIFKTYNPINYIPGAIVFLIARVININILLAAYIVKLINFILFMIVGYFCIKKIPFGKLLLAIYMFLPMIIQQATSLSADAVVNNLAISFIVFNLILLNQEHDLNIKQIIIYFVLTFAIALCKYVYFPITAMSLLLIYNEKISKKKKTLLIVFSMIFSVGLAIAWFVFTQKYVDVRQYIIEANVQPVGQVKYILTHPLNYIKVLYNTFCIHGLYYLLSFIGSELGYRVIQIPQIYMTIMLIGLSILPFTEKGSIINRNLQKTIMFIITIILILLILTGLYLTWSPLQFDRVAGVQGRYFIPVFIIALLTLVRKEKNVEIKSIEVKYFYTYLVINILTIITMTKSF